MLIWDTSGGGKPYVSIHTNSVCFLMAIVDVQSTIQFDPGFTATLVLHPATYLNKVLVASSQGEIQLWNIRTQLAAHSSYPIKFTYLVIPQDMHPQIS
jgi:U3 small nucleolar RNA-associated protein 21